MSFNKQLFRILLKIVLFAAFVLVTDLLLSTIIQYSLRDVGTGELSYQHVTKEKYEILIFGASKSTTNFNPNVISEVTGISCYSMGSTGSTFLAQYPQVVEILETYTPRLIIFELIGVDLNESLLSYKEGRVVDRMLLHSGRKEISDILVKVDKWHRIKSILKTYKFTSVVADRIVELFRNSNSRFDPKLGFNPKERNPNFHFEQPKSDPEPGGSSVSEYVRSPIIESAFMNMLVELRERGINAIFVHSPNYRNTDGDVDPLIIQLVKQHGFRFFDMADQLEGFDYDKYDYYADHQHLSKLGAEEYSRQVGAFISTLIQNK